MTTEESIQIKIDNINKLLQKSIDDKSIFDDCFKNRIIRPERKESGYPKYKGKSIECPNYQRPFDYDVTKKFSLKDFESFKETVNQCILLDAVCNLFLLKKFATNGLGNPDNNYSKLIESFARKQDTKNTELFMESVKECNGELDIWVVNISIHQCIPTHRVMYTVRVGTEFKFQDE
jgi:hypothetical protein